MKIDNFKFVSFKDNRALSTNKSLSNSFSAGPGCGCGGGFWSYVWNAIASLGGGTWGGLQSITVAIGNFFSDWGNGNDTGGPSNNTGSYNLYEYGNAITNGGPNAEGDFYSNILPQELFWLPPNTSNGEMYHFTQYRTALANFNTIFNNLNNQYPNINAGLLLNGLLEHHLPSRFQDDIDNGNIALVMDYLNNQDAVYNSNLWDLLQDFIYRFYDTVNYNIQLNLALNDFNAYKKNVLLKALGFNTSQTINLFNGQQLQWLEKNETLGMDIARFFKQNNNSVVAKAFGKLAVDAWIENKDAEVDFPNKVILDKTFTDNLQLKCVYDKLTKDNNPLFRNTVGAFIDDPKFNLTFRVGECESTDDQCTDSNNPYNIVITFEDVSTSPVEMAQAILHEAIHAEMARYIEQYQSGVDVNDRPRIFQLYQYYKGYYEKKDINHLYMIEKYLDPLTSALREFDNYNNPIEYYKSFAWDGLRAMDPNDVLSLPINSTYAGYRAIVIQNSTVCN